MDNMLIPVIAAASLAAIGLILAAVALVKIRRLRKRLVAFHTWRKEAEDSRNSAFKQLEFLQAEVASLSRAAGAIETLQSKVSLLERTFVPVTSPLTAPDPSTAQASRSTLSTPASYVQTMPADSSILGPQEQRLRALLDAFNATAREPTHTAVERFATDFTTQAGPGPMWRIALPDGHSAIVPGKEMLMNWAADYRGRTAQSIRNEHLEKWYQMAEGTDLILERVAVEFNESIIQRGALRGI